MGQLDTHLKDVLDAVIRPLRGVTDRRMFGSWAWFVNGKIFTLAWDGRPAVKLVDPAKYDALLSRPGAEKFSPMGPQAKSMGAWVVMPESSIDDEDELREWVTEAYRGIEKLPAKVVKSKKQVSKAKKPVAKKKAKR